jgi:hypothetical protein
VQVLAFVSGQFAFRHEPRLGIKREHREAQAAAHRRMWPEPESLCSLERFPGGAAYLINFACFVQILFNGCHGRLGKEKHLHLALAATLLAGASIVSYLWRALVPRPDQKLEVTHVTFAKLAELQDRPKYVELPGTLYNGLRPELARLLAERQINALINRLREGLASNPSKKFVLGEFGHPRTKSGTNLPIGYDTAGGASLAMLLLMLPRTG